MHHAVLRVDQHAGRGQVLQRLAMHYRVVERGPRVKAGDNLTVLLADANRAQEARREPQLLVRLRARLIDARMAVDRAEQTRRVIGGLGRSEDEKAAGIERVMEGGRDLLLELAVEVDEHVPAGDQVNAGERRILEQVV